MRLIWLLGAATLTIAGCGSSAHVQRSAHTATTGTTPPPAAQTTPNTERAPTAPSPKPSPPPKRSQPRPRTPPPSGGEPTVETVTQNGEVLLLNNGDVYSVSSGDASRWENEEVNVSEDESTITKADDGEQLEVSKVGDSSSGSGYPGAGEQHNQDTNSSDGALIVLEDGSVWEVAKSDRPTASPWIDTTSIEVSQEEGSHPGSYSLHNTDDHESLIATYIGDK